MKIFIVIFLLLGIFQAKAQSLDSIVEDYIRKNNVKTIPVSDTTYYKTGKPYVKNYSNGVKSLSVPKGVIQIPMPKGVSDVKGKIYSSYVSSNVNFTLYIVQIVNGKEVVTAVKGGDIMKGNRGRVDFLIDYSEYQKTTIYCYFLNGVIFGAPFIMSKGNIVKISNYEIGSTVLDQDIPALLIYEEVKDSVRKEKLIEKIKIGQYLSSNIKKYRDIYKQLGNYCIVYYRLTKEL